MNFGDYCQFQFLWSYFVTVFIFGNRSQFWWPRSSLGVGGHIWWTWSPFAITLELADRCHSLWRGSYLLAAAILSKRGYFLWLLYRGFRLGTISTFGLILCYWLGLLMWHSPCLSPHRVLSARKRGPAFWWFLQEWEITCCSIDYQKYLVRTPQVYGSRLIFGLRQKMTTLIKDELD